MNKVIKLFLELVQIDSVSGAESKVREYVKNLFGNIPGEYKIDKAGNLLIKLSGKGEPILLSAHLDTVNPGNGIRPIIEDGVIKSEGETILGADNKASLAAIIAAVLESYSAEKKPLEILFTVREETDGGVNFFNTNQIDSKIGYIADSSVPLGQMQLDSPYIENFEITFRGKEIHSSSPEDGNNVLLNLPHLLSSCPPGVVEEDTILNYGIINSGYATNTVPGVLKIEGELRSFDKEKFERWVMVLDENIKRIAQKNKCEVEIGHTLYCTGYNLSETSHSVTNLEKVYKNMTLTPQIFKSYGGSDAGFLNSKGIDVVNMGDGVIDAHTLDERIKVDDLVKLCEIYKRLINY